MGAISSASGSSERYHNSTCLQLCQIVGGSVGEKLTLLGCGIKAEQSGEVM